MVAVVDAILREEQRRKQAGDLRPIPFRPDHGHQMLDDLRKKTNQAIRRLAVSRGWRKCAASSWR
ncbi:hypothetical protein M3O75_16550 [Klebsiella pneumoniae]|nr:hypothetical protein [Klebsiella pneumoniae]